MQGAALPRGLKVRFGQADLTQPGWSEVLKSGHYDGAQAFAVLHHIPGEEQRVELLRQVRDLLNLVGCSSTASGNSNTAKN